MKNTTERHNIAKLLKTKQNKNQRHTQNFPENKTHYPLKIIRKLTAKNYENQKTVE